MCWRWDRFEKGRDQMDKIRVKKIHDEKAAVTLEINESIHTKTDGFKKDENGLYLNEGMGDEAIKHKRNEGFNASDRSEVRCTKRTSHGQSIEPQCQCPSPVPWSHRRHLLVW